MGLDPWFVAYVGAFGLSALACFVGIRWTFGIEDADTRRGLAGLLALSGVWALAQVAFLTLPTVSLRLAAYYVGLTVGFATVGAWLYFCSAYTGRSLHRVPAYRQAALGVFLAVLAVKYTNPLHGYYFTTATATMPFPHLAIEHGLFHWLAMGLAYALSAVGFFMLFELFAQTDIDAGPLVVLVGLLGLPVVANVAALRLPWLVETTHEPLAVAVFAVGTLALFDGRFETVRLAGNVDDPVVVLDRNDGVRQFNAAARETFPELRGAVGESFERTLPAVAAHLDDEDDRVVELDRDGETRYYMVSSNPFRADSSTGGRMVLATDVTRTQRYQNEIERKNERLSQFASVVSHDLRNPLNVAQGRVEMERGRRDSENLELAAGSLDRMERLIESVLTLAREGEDIGDLEPVTLAAVAEAAWQHVDAPAATLEVDTNGRFDADEIRLQQLLENLFRNSVEHGGDDTTVSVGMLAGRDGFYVADDGSGVPADERESVFEFGHTNGDGSGLGLTIVRTIAEAHGWEVSVTDADSGGARFEFTGVETVAPGATEAA